MALPSVKPTTTKAWGVLEKIFDLEKESSILSFFEEDHQRQHDFCIQFEDILVDFSKNRVSRKALHALLNLAEEVNLKEAIHAQFEGELINQTEERAVLHTALRSDVGLVIDAKPIGQDIQNAKAKMKSFVEDVQNGKWKGYSGKSITDIVNIGIGGSDLGPQMVMDALVHYKNHLNIHFVSNVDGDHVAETLKGLNPETTLCLVVSKSFGTQETLTNATTIRNWFLNVTTQENIKLHFVAVSANVDKAKDFGISPDNVFPMWDWVGGRFSLWSTVGLSIALGTGYSSFQDLLDGAHLMDEHFKTESFENNIPVILGLLSVWYNNFYKTESEAVIPYTQYLQKLAPYLQQAIMESNGKSIDRNGSKVDYQTGNIVWGEPGTNSQHAFFQLLHQGTKLIPADFIGFKEPLNDYVHHHDILMANFFAQTEALLKGKSEQAVVKELQAKTLDNVRINELKPYKVFDGNRPTTTILIDKLTPKSLGELIAMYEHKIFVQGVIWNIFSYDQWGVELGKQLANNVLEDFGKEDMSVHDPSTTRLLNYYKQ